MRMASSLSASGISRGFVVWAMLTFMPCCSMGVTTMKMINNTNITSTIGVTLMLLLIFAPSSRFASDMKRLLRPAGAAAALQEVIDQLARGVIHLHVERFDLAGEVVEHHDGRDGDEQPERRGHQRFR